MLVRSQSLTQLFLKDWESLSQHLVQSKRPFTVDGKSLDLACILAVSRLFSPSLSEADLTNDSEGMAWISN